MPMPAEHKRPWRARTKAISSLGRVGVESSVGSSLISFVARWFVGSFSRSFAQSLARLLTTSSSPYKTLFGELLSLFLVLLAGWLAERVSVAG